MPENRHGLLVAIMPTSRARSFWTQKGPYDLDEATTRPVGWVRIVSCMTCFPPFLVESPTQYCNQSGRLDDRVVDTQATQTRSRNVIYDRVEVVVDEVLDLTWEKHSRLKRSLRWVATGK